MSEQGSTVLKNIDLNYTECLQDRLEIGYYSGLNLVHSSIRE